MNLVGHVAVAVHRTEHASSEHLAGAMLPDLAAMARVRLAPAGGDLGDGIAVHHASDAAFHRSQWFNDRSQALRDALLAAGVDRGAARACAHAGVEMLLDGGWIADPRVRDASDRAFSVLRARGATRDRVHSLVAPVDRAHWAARLDRIATTIDLDAYRSPAAIATRLHHMTSGRARIELRREHVDTVTRELGRVQDAVLADADAVLAGVASACDHAAAGGP